MNSTTAEKRDTIVLGASAGGVRALERLLPAFTGVDAAVFVVVHLPADGQSILDSVLGRVTGYSVAFAGEGEAISMRRVYIAPPDRHLLLEDGRVRLWRGARENLSRPAIDVLFRSAAVARQGRVIGGVLSGLLDDGAAGLLSVKRCGGLAFVQHANDATESQMPLCAAGALGEQLDGAFSAEELGHRMAGWVGTPAPEGKVPEDVQLEVDMLLGKTSGLDVLSSGGAPLPLSCPECNGPLWGVVDGRLQRYRCHTGHTYGLESFLSAQGQGIEQALWAAIKGLEQRSQVVRNLARDDGMRGRPIATNNLEAESVQLRAHAETLRQVLLRSFREPQHERGRLPRRPS